MPATLRQADITTSHATKLPKDTSQVAGYQGERDIFVAGMARSYNYVYLFGTHISAPAG